MPQQQSIIREPEVAGSKAVPTQGGGRGAIVGDIMGDIPTWRKHRDSKFEAVWNEFYAKWRGFWAPEHKSFKTERSRLISPLTSMAVDMTTAEIVEAVLGREYFIDMPDDVADKDTQDVDLARKLLVQDLRREGFVDEFASIALNGCLYGTGIAKIQISVKKVKTISRNKEKALTVTETEVVQIKPVAIEPGNFVADPATRDIDEMKGCAHEFMMPITLLQRRQADGVYYNDVKVGSWRVRVMNQRRGDTEEGNVRDQGEAAYITEYYGLIPLRHFQQTLAEDKGTPLSDVMLQAIPEEEMIEVIATIANETTLLRVIANPLMTGERLMVAYQHEVVPGRFYGRGVAEKAANVQRAMDAEMRARIDSLAWANLPMFAADLTRLPPNSNMNAWPGKLWGTRGNPNEVLKEFKVSGPDQNSYAHIQDLERMGQQATGAMDSAGLRGGVRDETATGSALAASSFIKRSKRTMYNIEGFMNRLIRRVARLKMQFDPAGYPQDYEFQVRGSIGIMARELETQFMVNLMSVVGGDSPAAMPIIKAIFAHSGSPVRTDVLAALEKSEQENQPTDEERKLAKDAQKAQLKLPIAQLKKIVAETEKLLSESELKEEQADKTEAETKAIVDNKPLAQAKVIIELEENEIQERSLDIQEDKNKLTSRGLDIQQQIANQVKKK